MNGFVICKTGDGPQYQASGDAFTWTDAFSLSSTPLPAVQEIVSIAWLQLNMRAFYIISQVYAIMTHMIEILKPVCFKFPNYV